MIKTLPMKEHEFMSMPCMVHMISLLDHYESGKNWIIHNHLRLIAYKEMVCSSPVRFSLHIHFDWIDPYWAGRSWDACWMIRKRTQLRSFIERKWPSFSAFCIDAIDEENYVFVTVNVNPIHAYGMKGTRHQIFIHGYNMEKQQLLCSDFFGFPPKLQTIWISFDEINEGYSSLSLVSSIDDFSGACLWSFDDTQYNYVDDCLGYGTITDFDSMYVRDQLNRYLTSNNNRAIYQRDEIIASLNIYDALIQLIDDGMINETPSSSLYALRDHKLILRRLINKLEGTSQLKLLNDNSILLAKFDKIINYAIKAKVTNNTRTNDKLIRVIKEFRDHDIAHVQGIIDSLADYKA